jgi:hypothetical protein
MASGTADLQRDLGGAIMQSLLGALLTAGYAASVGSAIASSPDADKISAETTAQLQKSFDGAIAVAQRYPKHADQITQAAKESFLQGDRWAYTAGIIAVLVGAALIAMYFPKRDEERRLLAAYQAEDAAGSVPAAGA